MLPLLRKANKNWDMGKKLLHNQDYDFAANRLYYAVLQTVLTYAKIRNLLTNPNVKSGTHWEIEKVIAGEGKNSKQAKRAFRNLRGLRETADYGKETPDKEEIKKELEMAEKIKAYFSKKAQDENENI